MGKRITIIDFHSEGGGSQVKEHDENHKTRAKMKEIFGEVESFMEYEEKHGMHFSEKLSSYVCSKMVNDCEIDKLTGKHPETPKHTWSAQEVEETIKKLGLEFVPVHKFDYHYAANMAYADFYGKSIKEDVLCVRHAHAMVHDPDGYPELVFSRWLSDIVSKGEEIEWEKFI